MANWYSILSKYSLDTWNQDLADTINSATAKYLPFEFSVNDIVYNEYNLPNREYIHFGLSNNHIYNFRYIISGTTRKFIDYRAMRGRNRICRSFDDNDDFSTTYFTKLNTTNISGKYKFRQLINNLPDPLIRQGTIPVNVIINNVNYKNIVFTDNYDLYMFDAVYGISNNGYAFGAYSNPINLLAINGYRDDSFMSFTNNNSANDNTIKTEFVGTILDFGDIPQEVPQLFADWLNSNFDYIYPNTFNINTNTNINITSINDAPPMKKANLYVLGTYKKLTLTGTNDQIYILEWSSETPEGKRFGGLSLSTNNGSILIPANGEDIDINLVTSTTLYESYLIYRPLEDPFTIMLYQNSSEHHRVDKTDFLTEVGGYSGIFRDSANIVNPIIRVQANDIPNFNYVKIGILNRYYFVTDYDIVRTGLIDLYLTEDVLMTYKEGIYKLKAFVERNEYENNPLLVDKKRVIEEGVDVEVHSIENALMSETLFQPETDIRFVINGYKIDSADRQGV